jgi:hypothetical protein
MFEETRDKVIAIIVVVCLVVFLAYLYFSSTTKVYEIKENFGIYTKNIRYKDLRLPINQRANPIDAIYKTIKEAAMVGELLNHPGVKEESGNDYSAAAFTNIVIPDVKRIIVYRYVPLENGKKPAIGYVNIKSKIQNIDPDEIKAVDYIIGTTMLINDGKTTEGFSSLMGSFSKALGNMQAAGNAYSPVDRMPVGNMPVDRTPVGGVFSSGGFSSVGNAVSSGGSSSLLGSFSKALSKVNNAVTDMTSTNKYGDQYSGSLNNVAGVLNAKMKTASNAFSSNPISRFTELVEVAKNKNTTVNDEPVRDSSVDKELNAFNLLLQKAKQEDAERSKNASIPAPSVAVSTPSREVKPIQADVVVEKPTYRTELLDPIKLAVIRAPKEFVPERKVAVIQPPKEVAPERKVAIAQPEKRIPVTTKRNLTGYMNVHILNIELQNPFTMTELIVKNTNEDFVELDNDLYMVLYDSQGKKIHSSTTPLLQVN